MIRYYNNFSLNASLTCVIRKDKLQNNYYNAFKSVPYTLFLRAQKSHRNSPASTGTSVFQTKIYRNAPGCEHDFAYIDLKKTANR